MLHCRTKKKLKNLQLSDCILYHANLGLESGLGLGLGLGSAALQPWFMVAATQVPSTHPGLMASAMAWHGRVASKENLLDTADLSGLIVLQRDHGPGRV